jgi:hypothetical protein
MKAKTKFKPFVVKISSEKLAVFLWHVLNNPQAITDRCYGGISSCELRCLATDVRADGGDSLWKKFEAQIEKQGIKTGYTY